MTLLSYIALTLGLIYACVAFAFFVGLLFPRQGRNRERLKVSVIIAARNEQDHIGHILHDLTHQTYPPDHYEIVVADDGSTDATAQIVEEFSQKYSNVKLVPVEKVPPGISPKKYALDCAVRHSQYEIILATDADCRVGSRWIERMVTYFEPAVGFVIGFSQFGKRGQRLKLLEALQAFDFMQLMGATAGACNLGLPLAASGQNLGYRRRAFQRVGGFKKVAHRVSGDDILILQLIRKYTTYRVVFASDPSTFAVSEPQPTLKELIQQRIRWASNGSFQIRLNIPFFTYLLIVFLNNLVLLVGLPLSLITGAAVDNFMLCLWAKIAAEGLVAAKSASYFHRTDLLKYFPIWFLVQMPYVVLMGILGSIGNFSWKDRNHSAEVRPRK